MRCPSCGTYNTRVVMTKSVEINGYAKVRRRACNRCEHRWYSAQGPEHVVQVQWEGSKQRVAITEIYELDPNTGQRFAAYSEPTGRQCSCYADPKGRKKKAISN